MKRYECFFNILMILLIILLITPATYVLAKTITVDGNNTSSEWDDVTPTIDEETDETPIGNSVDIRDVYITGDSSNLYFRLDTWSMPPGHETNRLTRIYIDTDQNNSTGCDDVVTHGGGSGYERELRHLYIDNPPYFVGWATQVFQCSSGSFSYLDSANYGYNNILEFSLTLANLGISEGDSIDLFVYYDGGNIDPDDEVPDSGNFTYDWPTAITLADFAATPTDAGVRVTWETAMEMDNAGFNLYRSTAPTGDYEQLNGALIPPQFPGQALGGQYEWLDSDVEPDTDYYYKLEDVDIAGVRTLHGPVLAITAAPTAVRAGSLAARGGLALLGIAAAAGVVGALALTRKRRVV